MEWAQENGEGPSEERWRFLRDENEQYEKVNMEPIDVMSFLKII